MGRTTRPARKSSGGKAPRLLRKAHHYEITKHYEEINEVIIIQNIWYTVIFVILNQYHITFHIVFILFV